jgi:hypothetical protein
MHTLGFLYDVKLSKKMPFMNADAETPLDAISLDNLYQTVMTPDSLFSFSNTLSSVDSHVSKGDDQDAKTYACASILRPFMTLT